MPVRCLFDLDYLTIVLSEFTDRGTQGCQSLGLLFKPPATLLVQHKAGILYLMFQFPRRVQWTIDFPDSLTHFPGNWKFSKIQRGMQKMRLVYNPHHQNLSPNI